MAETEAVAEDEGEAKKRLPRSADLLGRKDSKIRKKLDELHDTIFKGWQDQADRSDDQMDWWDCYNCKINNNQFYNGNAQIFVPIVRDAINARATRFVNQLFPTSMRYVDVVSSEGKQPAEVIALVDHYIRRAKLKTKVAKPLCINGDVEGQYNLYVDWNEIRRFVISRETHGPKVEADGIEIEAEGDDIEDVSDEEEILDGMPRPEVLHDSDVLVLPATADSTEEALEVGGVVVICRRWSRSKIEQMIDDEEFDDAEGKELLKDMKSLAEQQPAVVEVDAEKKLAEALGIRKKGREVIGWEVWHKLPLNDGGEYSDKGKRRLCRIYYGPERRQLGCKRNPYWNDLLPLLSEPVIKIAGSFKGPSLVESVAPIQYEANDAANEGADSAHYSAMPMVRVSPNVTQPIILNLGAILKADQGEVEMISFPDLTPRAVTRIQIAAQQIFQTLGVNPSMLPQQTSTSKRNQAQVAQEQQVDLLTTAEAVTVLEEGIFTPYVGLCVDYDHQFRDRALTVRMFGVMGQRATVEQIPPLQNRARYSFKWLGAELARNAAQLQQMFMGINVLRGLRQDLQAEGYGLKLGPVVEIASMSMFGPMVGAQVVLDMRHQSSIDPETENQLLSEGHTVPVMPLDQDIEHIKAHMQGAQMTGDPFGHFKMHIQAHMQQMQQKVQAQAMQAMQQQQQGQQGQQRPRGQGQVNGARQGALPAGPRQVPQGPPGMIRPDAMPRAGAMVPPRRM